MSSTNGSIYTPKFKRRIVDYVKEQDLKWPFGKGNNKEDPLIFLD